ncbi:CheY-like chemotaxis protein [Sphingobium sp. B2D3A]|uniref:response regulator n=1 Tax=unclassified Sphingobium TaxID=2611147 RepID=UPI0022242F57|nr:MULTISPECIES: response regulator [unclassified Sphingobium]MCW2337026.1 CheY-like chemotaxis protein [Sphingobium sp. B2D3A]MCW2365385.1 CheY-like chemotaxis protein [Sphingobium sp. B7D2B]MCW2370536.1 CheY-like chemotaxis protein [Sphingobium sp. B11D3D]MCW2380880.1 CheY-like chemotaxis protein [Sphingobium sp. B2D3B]MCW2386779.1 CheY-like chemotaxis protein [Sphingobium sp. B2D3D]
MRLDDLTILIVEDEPIIALVLEDKLLDRGANPVLAHSFDSAAELIGRQALDLAILDVNIHGQQSYPLAQMLRDKGTPCIFVTGYGGALHPEAFAHVTTLTKPYSVAALDDALQTALAFRNASQPEPDTPLT